VSQADAREMAAIESGDRNRVTLMLPGECIPFHAVERDDEVDCLNGLVLHLVVACLIDSSALMWLPSFHPHIRSCVDHWQTSLPLDCQQTDDSQLEQSRLCPSLLK